MVGSGSTTEDHVLQQMFSQLAPTASPHNWLEAVSEFPRQNGAIAGYLGWIEYDEHDAPTNFEIAAQWYLHKPVAPEVGQHVALHKDWHLAYQQQLAVHAPILIDDVLNSPLFDHAAKDAITHTQGIRAVALLPMSLQGRWISAVCYCWPTPQQFDEQTKRIFSAIIRHGGPIINAVRLFEQNLERTRRAEFLSEVNTALSVARDEQDILQAIAVYAKRFDPLYVVLTYINVDTAEANAEVFTAAASGLPPHPPDQHLPPPILLAPLRLAGKLDPDCAIFVEDLWTDERITGQDRELVKQHDHRAVVVLPIKTASTWHGAVLIGWQEVRQFSPQERYLYAHLLPSLISVVAMRRAYLAQVEAEQEAALLYQLAQSINAATTFTDVVRGVANLHHQADVVHLLMWEHYDVDRATTFSIAASAAASNPDYPQLTGQHYPADMFPITIKMRHERQWFIEDTHLDERVDDVSRASWDAFNVRAQVVIHLYSKGRWFGSLTFSYSEPRQFTAKDRRLSTGIGDLITAAVERIWSQSEVLEANEESTLLYQLAGSVNAARTYQDVTNAVALLLPDCDGVLLGLWEHLDYDKAAFLNTVAMSGSREDSTAPAIRRVPRLGVVDQVRHEKLWIIEDITEDTRLDAEARALFARLGRDAVLCVPLRTGDRLWGLIICQYLRPRQFTERERRTALGIGDLVQAAVERIQAEQGTINAKEESDFLYQLAQDVNAATTYQDVMDAVAKLQPDGDGVFLNLFEHLDYDRATYLEITAAVAMPENIKEGIGRSIPLKFFPIGPLIRHERAWEINDIENDPRVDEVSLATWRRLEIGALMCVNLKRAERFIGLLSFKYTRPHRFTERERRLALGIADLALAAVERIYAQKETSSAKEESEFLYQLAQDVNAATSYQGIMDAIARVQPDGDGVFLNLYEYLDFDRGTYIEVTAAVALPENIKVGLGGRTPLSSLPMLRLMRSERAFEINDTETDPKVDEVSRATWRRLDTRALLCVNLKREDRWIGMFSFKNTKPHVYTDRERRLTLGMADLALAAVERIHAQQETASAKEESDFLYQLAQDVNAATTYQGIMDAIAKVQPDGDGVFLNLFEHLDYDRANYLEVVAGVALTYTYKDAFGKRVPLADYPIGKQIRHERLWVVEDVDSDQRVDPTTLATWKSMGIQSLVCVNLFRGERFLGLFFFEFRRPHRVNEQELRLALGIADLALAAVERIHAQQETTSAKEESDFLYQLAQDVNAATTYQEIMDAVAKLQQEGDGVFLNLFEHLDYDKATYLEIAAAATTVDSQFRKNVGKQEPLTSYPIGDKIRHARLWTVSDIETDPIVDPVTRETWRRFGTRALTCVNLKRQDQFFGLLFFKYTDPHICTDRERRLALGIADLALAAVERIHAQQETASAKEESDFLYQLAQDVNAATTYQEIMTAVYKVQSDGDGVFLNLFEHLDYDKASYVEITAGGNVIEHFQHRVGFRYPLSALPILAVQRDELLWSVEDVHADPRIDPVTRETWDKFRTRAVICVNLKRDGRFFGLLFFKYGSPHRSTEKERRLALGIADLVLPAMERIRLQIETARARQQRELLFDASAAINASNTFAEVVQSVERLNINNTDVHLILARHAGDAEYYGGHYYEIAAATENLIKLPSYRLPDRVTEYFELRTTTEIYVFEDVRNEPMLDEEERQTLLDVGIGSLAGYPLKKGNHLLGALCLVDPQPRQYSQQVREIFEALGRLVFAAVERIRLQQETTAALERAERLNEQIQRLAALEERNRLARELHDSVSQALYGIGLGAQTARAMWERDPAVVKESLDYVLNLSEAALVEMRALIFELRPESIENEGLVTALAKQGASLQARNGIDVRLELGTEPVLSVDAKDSIYRIAREALHNVVKHAAATQVILRVVCADSRMRLEIIDNGVGFDSGQDFPGHLGLKSMRERVIHLGGEISLISERGKGTHLTVIVPTLL